jgi:branched-chain amino acid transport system permease protein
VTIIQGAIFVVCVLLFRSGMIGVMTPWLKRRGITG